MTCPICNKPADPAYRPFCSRRCADIDLGRWLTESYAIPVPEDEEESASESEDAPGARALPN
jgi:endogenous inhibitor of DNA gyrase (YacG/DUF329 family)